MDKKLRKKMMLIAIPAFVLIGSTIFFAIYKSNQRLILKEHDELLLDIKLHHYDKAFQRMTNEFRRNISLADFPKRSSVISKIPPLNIDVDLFNGKAIVYDKKEHDSPIITYNKINGKWLCNGVRIYKKGLPGF